MSGEGGRGGGFYLRTLIDIVTMVAIFVTSEKNRTSDYLFFCIRVRYSRYDNFTRRREQEIEESLVHPSADSLAFSHRLLNLISYRCSRNT